MHEMSLAEGVLQLIEDAAARDGFRRVRTVWLEIGQLAGVEVEAMRFCFDAVVRGSVAEGAQLEIASAPGSGWCMSCMQEVAMAEALAACPVCGGFELKVSGGTGMRVKELEVE